MVFVNFESFVRSTVYLFKFFHGFSWFCWWQPAISYKSEIRTKSLDSSKRFHHTLWESGVIYGVVGYCSWYIESRKCWVKPNQFQWVNYQKYSGRCEDLEKISPIKFLYDRCWQKKSIIGKNRFANSLNSLVYWM